MASPPLPTDNHESKPLERTPAPSYKEKSPGIFITSVDVNMPPVPPYPYESKDKDPHLPKHYRPDGSGTTPRAQHSSRWTPLRLSNIKGAIFAFAARLCARARPLRSLLILYAFSVLFCFLFCTFIYAVLIKGHVETPGVLWTAAKTNYVVGVLSQFSAILTAATVKALLGALKRAFLYRRQGMEFASWVGLGGSEWWTVFQVAVVNGGLDPWCDIRLLLPVMSLAFGSIVKFNADFSFFFQPSKAQIPVYAGLIKPDVFVMDLVPAADTAMYFSIWSSSLLTNSMFATDLSFPLENFTCTNDCRAVMMPGGLTIARQAKQYLNESLLFGGVFAETIDTVRIDNGTGMILKFETPDPSTVVFNSTECVYTGGQVKNGVQVCVRQINDSILVGWSACPKALYDRDECTSNPSWRSLPLTSSTLMSLYTIQTTTSYSLSSQSIINVVPLSPAPTQIPLSATEYSRILTRILIPPSSPPANATVTQLRDFDRDTHNIDALIDAITWMHRTFLKSFPSDRTSATSNLQNLLAVPVQFSVTARSFANYSVVEKGLQDRFQFPLPESMRTLATGGWSKQRLKILPWAGALFIGADLAVHIAMGLGIVWLLMIREDREVNLPDEAGIKEWEDVREAGRVQVVGVPLDDEEEEEEGRGDGRQGWFVRWLGWVFGRLRWGRRKSANGGDVEKGEVSKVPLEEFSLKNNNDKEVSVWKTAWRNRMVRVVGEREDVRKLSEPSCG